MGKEPMDCLRAFKIFHILFYGGFACTIAVLFLGRLTAPLLYLLGWLGIIGIFGGLIFGFITVRCPYCGKRLVKGRLPGVPNFCPRCGERLREVCGEIEE